MNRFTNQNGIARGRAGFTVMELLISLALLAMLLASAGIAVHAAITSQNENARLAAATQAARVVLNRLTRDVRTAAAVDYYSPSDVLRIVPPEDGSGLEQIEYTIDYGQGKLLYRTTAGGETTSHTLLGDNDIRVITFFATHEIGQDWQGLDCTKSVTVNLAFEVNGRRFTQTVSAAPRRNQQY